MAPNNGSKLGNMSAMVSLVRNLPLNGQDAAQRNRKLLAELCKVVGAHVAGGAGSDAAAGLSPRMRQTLEALLIGDSEKQIALKLNLSPHTVHVYVKQLYKKFNATSRGELLSRFVRGA